MFARRYCTCKPSDFRDVSGGYSGLHLIEINGGRALLHDKYRYHFGKKYKTGAAIWRCSNYRKIRCLGTITVKDDHLLAEKPHLCKPDVHNNFKLMEIASLKQMVQNSDSSIPQLYKQKLAELRASGFDLPTFKSVKSSLYRSKNSSGVIKK